jgi:hypothetical protein
MDAEGSSQQATSTATNISLYTPEHSERTNKRAAAGEAPDSRAEPYTCPICAHVLADSFPNSIANHNASNKHKRAVEATERRAAGRTLPQMFAAKVRPGQAH